MSEIEIWLPVPGYEGRYEASSLGRVRSLTRAVGRHRIVRNGRILRPAMMKGYLAVRLYGGDKTKSIRVHRIVALSFLGPAQEGMVVCHNDGDPLNNKISNLRYDTLRGNQQDCIRHGTTKNGEKNGRAILTEKDVRFIRYQNKGLSYREMANMFGVKRSTIYQAAAGITWRHIARQEVL